MGREPLWRVWWLLLVPSNVLIGLTEQSDWFGGIVGPPPLAAVFVALGFIIIRLAIMVMIWRCAPNVVNPIWCYLARLSVVLSCFLVLLNFVAPQWFLGAPG